MPESPAASLLEVIYAIRRTDGELMFGEFGWNSAEGPDDWEAALLDSEYADDAREYELVRMVIEPIGRRTLPTCSACELPAAHWGLCHAHALEDDPEGVPSDCACPVVNGPSTTEAP